MAEEGTSESPGSSGVTVAEGGAAAGSAGLGDDAVAVDCWDAFQWDVREGCEVRQILDRIADKWSLLVVALLQEQTLRFNELRRAIDGISQRMLTVTLRHLERDGLVCRTVHPVVPPRVEYCLTPLGHTLLGTVEALVRWTEAHQEEIVRARAEFDSAEAAVTAG